MKQPDRDRALRALEKVHERLDRLNEQHWAKLEREGKVKSLEDIEAMDVDAATAPASEFSGNPKVLPGRAPTAGMARSQFPEKDQVLSGPTGGRVTRVSEAVASIWDSGGDSPGCHPICSEALRTTEGQPRNPPVREGSAVLCAA